MHMRNERAIVMGGSMAGLLAARVLSEQFEQVVLVERDTLPQGAENRRGVPQGRHTHGLLAGGFRVLNQLFPGFGEDAFRAGGIPADLVRDFRWVLSGALLARPTSEFNGLAASRPFIENQVRRRVLALPNLLFRQSCQVKELVTTPDRRRITGIRTDSGDELTADLIVDATGRGSRTPQWLEALGYQKPEEERVEISLGYTTRFFRRSPGDLTGDLGSIIAPTPQGKRGGAMVAQEGDRWTVTLLGHFGHYAPEDLPGFIEFARTLPAPFIHEVIRHAEPLGDAVSARYPASLRRRYERLRRFPERYLVIGDGVCSFNPIYGQGMSVASLESLELASAVAEGDANLARRYFARIAKVADIPWSTAVGNDLRMPETVAKRSAAVNAINWYVDKLHHAAQDEAELSLAFHKVANLLAPPPAILHPKLAWRVMRWHAKKGAGTKPLLASVTFSRTS